MEAETSNRTRDPLWLDRGAYPFSSRWMELSRGSMHYVDEGAGEPVLFVHGTPTWSFEWRHLIAGLSGRCRCIAPDHLGFGLSDRPPGGAYTPEWHAENLAEFVGRLALKRFSLVVHDFGGPIGLPLVFDDSTQVARLVLLNTWMWSLRGDRQIARAGRLLGGRIGRVLYRRLNLSLRAIMPAAYADRRKLTPEIHRQYLGPFPDAWSRGAVLWPLAAALMGSDAHYRSLWESRSDLEELPALIVWGMKDPAFGPAYLERWKETLPGARVVELTTGHWPQEEAPGDVLQALEDFLADSAAGGLS